MDCRFGRFVLSASSETQGQLQSSSKVLKHFPNVDLGITVASVLQNTRCSILGRERAHYSENKSVRSKNLKNFPENSRETVSVSTICDQYCSRDDSIVPTSCPWASEDVLSELIRTAVVICLNPLTPKSDQYLFSLNNFNTFLRETVQRIYKIITKEEMFLSFIKILVSKRKSKE